MSYIVSINGILSAGVGRFYCKYMAEGKNDLMENTLAIARRLYWVLSVFRDANKLRSRRGCSVCIFSQFYKLTA